MTAEPYWIVLVGVGIFLVRAFGGARGRPPVARPPAAGRRPLPATIEELRAEMLRDLEAARTAEERLEADAPATSGALPSVTAPKRMVQPVVRPPAEQRIDYEQQAELVIQARREVAERHNVALDASTHRAFHRRTEAAAAVTPVARRPGFDPRRAREGLVWREILSPPLALRDGDER